MTMDQAADNDHRPSGGRSSSSGGRGGRGRGRGRGRSGGGRGRGGGRGGRGRGRGGRGRTSSTDDDDHERAMTHTVDEDGVSSHVEGKGGGGGRGKGGKGGSRRPRKDVDNDNPEESHGGRGRGRGKGRGGRGRGRGRSGGRGGRGGRGKDRGPQDATTNDDHDDDVESESAVPMQSTTGGSIPIQAALSPFISAPSSVPTDGFLGSADGFGSSNNTNSSPTEQQTQQLQQNPQGSSSSVLSGGGGVVLSHPPIFMSRLNTHLSLDGLNSSGHTQSEEGDDKLGGRDDGDGEDHIAEQLAAGLLIDDDDYGEDYDRGATAMMGYNANKEAEEKKVSTEEEEEKNDLDDKGKAIKPKGLMTLPAGFSFGEGGHVLTSEEAEREKKKKQQQQEEEEDAKLKGDGKEEPSSKKSSKKKSKKKKDKAKGGGDTEKASEETASDTKTATVTSTSDAIKNLKAQEVSIGESTKVQMKKSESTISLASSSYSNKGDTTKGSAGGVINLLGGNNKITGSEKTTSSKKTKKKKTKKGSAPQDTEAAKLRAARQFNRSVRLCIERSDPNAMRTILRDKSNHHFALDSHVLETVMKAYVMAAMFDDALYCLRNCTLPGTLGVDQSERILQCLPQNLRNSSAYTAADMINALCIATEFDEPTSRTYFMRVVRGIALEFLEEATSARDRICSAPCERLVRSSYCVVDARLRRGRKVTDLVVDPGHQLGVFIPDTNDNRGMQAGDAVSILPYAGPYPMSAESLDRNMIEATVTSAQPLVLRLQDKGNTDLFAMLVEPVEGNVYRIDKLANRMGFTRQLAAAVSVVSSLQQQKNGMVEDDYYVIDKRHPCPELVKAITAMDENIDRVMMAGGNLNPQRNNNKGDGNMTSTAAICSQAVPWNINEYHRGGFNDNGSQDAIREETLLALEKNGALEGLNASQRLAVQGAASNRLTLVQGPPGTGKTAVAIRILQHWARLAQARAPPGGNPSPILATSDSNIAVDNLVEGCANVGLRVVRLGRPEAIRPELLKHCIDRPSEGGGKGSSGSFGNYGGISASSMKEKMKVLKNAQVVCCTCIGSGGDILDSMTFERVMVDEATQATEPAVLVPLTRGCRQLVLVGDHCQLPPTVLSTRAEEEGLGVPLFSRMVACGVPPFMLDTQYRMHPGISMFPSDLFYGGKLNDGVSPPERRPLHGFPWPREEFPIAFIPVTDSVEIDDGVSKANEAEAAEVCNAVVHLLNGGQCSVSDIAVVTPYAAQVRLIRRQLRDMLPRGPPFVEVSSTDGFQGREKEAVIFSAVRSNSWGQVGFVSDWRRINVSFTRARRALIVVGNPDTLRRGDPDTFGAWISWADAHGVNMLSPGKPRGRYDPEVLRKVRGGTTAAEMLKDVLDRQQAQLKTAKQQQARAAANAVGHIMGKDADPEKDADEECPQALRADLATMENTDGCWDDSDDDIEDNVSGVTTPASDKAGEDGTFDAPQDAWDL